MKRFITIAFLSLFVFFVSQNASAQASGKVIVAPLRGTVGVQLEQFVARVVLQAENEKAGLIVFKLDTPGGLVEAMRGITQTILASKVPIAMWVPPGGRAASAGAFMMQAAHIAAMSSVSNLGAAHPVVASGGDIPDSDMKKKITEDLTAQMRALTHTRKRNEEVAQKMIMESLSLTAHEALQANVIDIVADDLDALLSAVRGRSVIVDGHLMKIDASASAIENVEMNFQEQFIQFLSSPDIAYLLLMLGIYAIIFEILSPGGFVLGTSGAIMILLGAYGLRMLPLNWAGIILLIAGITVMIIDLLIGGMGVLSAFGGVAIIVGGLIIYRAPGGELLRYSMTFVTGAVVAATGFFCWPFGLS